MRTGVIDLGTNTILLLVVDEAMQPVVDVCRFARLGQDVDATHELAPAAIARALEVCREYRALLDEHGVVTPIVAGTQALREARNAHAFVAPAEDVLRAQVQIISGEREAQLAFASVVRTFPELRSFIVVDVGGGSTEIIVGADGAIARAASLPIGAVRLTERHLRTDPPTADETRALFAAIDEQLATLELPRGVPVIATAGTATTLAALALRSHRAPVTGYKLSTMALDAQLARLLTAKLAARQSLAGMEPGRADVIAAGVAILSRLLARVDGNELVIADRGVRWGLVYEVASPR